MGRGAPLTRRGWLAGAAVAAIAGCAREPAPLRGGWVGPSPARGHRLRDATAVDPARARPRRADVLVVGAGIAGLAAARGFMRAGVDDVHLLELDDHPGGNSRGHAIGGIACPMGAHYLPQPGGAAPEVAEWLHEIGLLRSQWGRTLADERHLCHSPQERLFVDGAWHDGLLPPADPASPTMAQYRRFAARVAGAPRFAIPAHRAPWTAEHAALDAIPFAGWLDRQGLVDERLRWYLDYCCRDDYGAGAATVSAWAGLHYFASRHGFEAPGDGEGDREPVFTWPEGNAWLVQRLAAPLAGRLHTGRVVLHVREERHAVQVLALDGDAPERWTAGTVVLATPLAVSARLLAEPGDALRQVVAATVQAPWRVANLHLDRPLIDRPGMPPAWDNVIYGSRSLGYVDAMHQSLRPHAGATVLTHYATLDPAARSTLLDQPWSAWAQRTVDELAQVHPDLRWRVQQVDIARWGHAMAVPRPSRAALAAARSALRGGHGRVRLAHADLAGYSVFEEAFIAGTDAARAPPVRAAPPSARAAIAAGAPSCRCA